MKRNTPPRRKNSGFTLIEMLIVVAIIAILIAVSIPLVSSALERARVATDAANERACKAEALICFLNGYTDDGSNAANKFSSTTVYCYNAQDGKLVANKDNAGTPYGKCTKKHNVSATGSEYDKGHKGMYLWVSVDTEGNVAMTWSEGAPSGLSATTSSSGLSNSGLHGINVDAS